MIAVIVPVHNEEALLGDCLASLREAARAVESSGEPVRAVVALDRCTDRSRAIALALGAEVIEVHAGTVGAVRRAAAERALALGARWLASTDADSRVPPDWLRGQLRYGADAFCGMVRVDDWSGYAPATVEAYLRAHPHVAGHRHVHGANLGLSARAYRRCGGFAPLACGEDVALVAALEACGASIRWAPAPLVVTSARREARARGGFATYLAQLERDLADAAAPAPLALAAGG
ncbi:glycosyltransferase [Luteimonas sp. Y-2-2-4F]|nr:glycosyltransferase [Luteimonas sp. Y-2-2-4F]